MNEAVGSSGYLYETVCQPIFGRFFSLDFKMYGCVGWLGAKIWMNYGMILQKYGGKGPTK